MAFCRVHPTMDAITHIKDRAFPLAQAAEGDEVFVTSFNSDKVLVSRLMDLGLVSGARVKIIHRRGGDVIVARDNMRLALGQTTVERVMVVPCDDATAGGPKPGM